MRNFGWLRRGCLPGLILAAVVVIIGVVIPRMGVDWPTQRILAPIIAIGLVVILFMWTSGAPRDADGGGTPRQDLPRGWTAEDQKRHERLKPKDRFKDQDDEDGVRPDDFRR